jgi:fucose 4-O-acetylase-like acetyltransferase
MTTFNNRLPWIDTLKGIAISLVVLGHAMNTGPFRNWIYLFHIPLFFLLSGYLHKPVSNLGVYARRKAKHLLLPYVCFTIVATVLWFAHALHQGITNEKIRENLVVILWGVTKCEVITEYFGS